jgi:ribosome assembly protein RRB1
VEDEETKDNLRFEDPFIEEYVEEDDAFDEGADGDVMKDINEDGGMEIIQSWNPLTSALEPGEKLEMDVSAYKMHHALSPEWPSLSFDFLRDELGESRTRFPHTLTAAVGTQADKATNNKLTIMKISDLSKIHVETEDDILGEEYDPGKDNDDDDDNDDESSEEEVDLDPVIEHFSIPHYGGVNRVRVMPQNADIVATWSDAGRVNLFNVDAIRQRFFLGNNNNNNKTPVQKIIPSKPFFIYTKHSTEGFAMDWSTVQAGQLVTGDCHGGLSLWNPSESSYNVSKFMDGSELRDKLSIEDLQWSPTEATVLAAAECGGCVKIFDTRAPHKAMIAQEIHKHVDVNVLSWNRQVSNLLATGGDDGTLGVWDLRHFAKSTSSAPQPLARLTPHKTPITSVEWHPTDESMLVVTDSVGAYIYDLSVEAEEDENQPMTDNHHAAVPPQLLFVHCGSEQFKEAHWHPQITSCVMTTALTGFSIFIPSNL